MKGVKRDNKFRPSRLLIILSKKSVNFSVHVVNCPRYWTDLIENKIVKNVSNILVVTLCDE